MSEKQISGRIPPHNDEAERSVLGAALISRDAMYQIFEELKEEDFYDKRHAEIFRVMAEMDRKGSTVDSLTLSDELRKQKILEMVGGRAYIAALSSDLPSAMNAVQYAVIVKEKAVLRRLIHAADEIMKRSFDEAGETKDIIDFSEQEIFKIGQTGQRKEFIKIFELMQESINRIQEAEKNKGQIKGVGTGFSELDKYTNGLQPSNLIIVAARPGMGKTSFALNLGMNAAIKHGKSVAYFSFEMSRHELGQRLIAMNSRVDSENMRNGTLERSEWSDITRAVDELAETRIFIDDNPGVGMMEIKNKCRRIKQEYGLDLIIVDYLQLMSMGGRTESRQQEISALSRSFKLLAMELEIPVILLSQLSRAPETREDHRPRMSDLRESGAIEQDADIILFLYQDSVYNPDSDRAGICEVIIGKNRAGRTGSFDLAWLSSYTRFNDIARKA